MMFSFINSSGGDEDEELKEERFKLQAELIRRQVEHELDGDSDEPLLYFFRASDDVRRSEIEEFIESLSSWGIEAFVYREGIEHASEEQIRAFIEDAAPEVGLRVEETERLK